MLTGEGKYEGHLSRSNGQYDPIRGLTEPVDELTLLWEEICWADLEIAVAATLIAWKVSLDIWSTAAKKDSKSRTDIRRDRGAETAEA